MASITNPPPLPPLYHRGTGREEGKNADSAVTAEQAEEMSGEDTPAGQVQKFVQMSDEMSAAMTQFGYRRRYDRKAAGEGGGFEAVLDEEVKPRVDALLALLGRRHVSIETLLRHVRSLFPDDSDLVIVLRELLRRRALSEAVTGRLRSLLKQVEAQANPRDMKAGINCGLKARLFGRKHLALKPGLLRSSYRRFLQNDQPEIEEYKDWITSYGYQQREWVLGFIEAALLTDIDALDPSCSLLEFGPLIGKLGQLKRLRSADALFIKLLLANKVTAGLHKSEQEWLILLFSLLQSPDDISAHLQALWGETMDQAPCHQRSAVLQIIYQACKSLPVELFTEPQYAGELLERFQALAALAWRQEIR